VWHKSQKLYSKTFDNRSGGWKCSTCQRNARFGQGGFKVKKVSVQFESAMKEIRKNKVMARRNVSACCAGCVDLKVADDASIIWHFGGQGNRFEVAADGAYGAGWNGERFDGVYFNHSGLNNEETKEINENGKMVVAVFEKHGIVIDWDGSWSSSIYVNFKQTAMNFKMEQAEISINTPEAVLV
jgi:hypothetical protein